MENKWKLLPHRNGWWKLLGLNFEAQRVHDALLLSGNRRMQRDWTMRNTDISRRCHTAFPAAYFQSRDFGRCLSAGRVPLSPLGLSDSAAKQTASAYNDPQKMSMSHHEDAPASQATLPVQIKSEADLARENWYISKSEIMGWNHNLNYSLRASCSAQTLACTFKL